MLPVFYDTRCFGAHWMCWCSVQVLLACFIVPAWLAVIRELLQQQQLGQAAALAVGGLAVLLVLNAVNQRAAAARAATAAATVTAGTVRRCLPSGGPCCWCRGPGLTRVHLRTGHSGSSVGGATQSIFGE
jgi:hypothetical protein